MLRGRWIRYIVGLHSDVQDATEVDSSLPQYVCAKNPTAHSVRKKWEARLYCYLNLKVSLVNIVIESKPGTW